MKIKLYSIMIDCPNPCELAKFYAVLIKWDIMFYDDDYACLGAPGTNQGEYPAISFQRNPDYAPPVWPEQPGAQQQMAHLDFAVDDLEAAVKHALNCGARLADAQFSEGWRVMLDPVGHPFCLCDMKAVIQSEHFALK